MQPQMRRCLMHRRETLLLWTPAQHLQSSLTQPRAPSRFLQAAEGGPHGCSSTPRISLIVKPIHVSFPFFSAACTPPTHPPDSRSLWEKTCGEAARAAAASTRTTSARKAAKSKLSLKARCFCVDEGDLHTSAILARAVTRHNAALSVRLCARKKQHQPLTMSCHCPTRRQVGYSKSKAKKKANSCLCIMKGKPLGSVQPLTDAAKGRAQTLHADLRSKRR